MGLWHFPSVVWNFNVVADEIYRLKVFILVFQNGFEFLIVQTVLPFLKLFQDLQSTFAIDHYHARPFDEHCPIFLILVGKQCFDF